MINFEGLSPTVSFAAEWAPSDIELPPIEPGRLRMIPLGGLGEIGKNMMLFHYQDDIVVVDCGVMFPASYMHGVDLVLPNFSYLVRHRHQVRAILVTHGHEDHIGALPYVWPHLPEVPVVGTRLTLGLIRSKLEEFGLSERLLTQEVKAGDKVALGQFSAEFFHVVHSISDSVGIALHTPLGTVIHTGDFKFDTNAERDTDVEHLSNIAGAGVLALLSDSTYAERPGHSTSESVVADTFEELFGRLAGRIIVTTFASSIPRLAQIVKTAVAHGRYLCFHGRSLEANVAVASELGYLQVPSDRMVSIENIATVPDDKLVLIATGSQGEPLSAIALMATRRHRWVELRAGDTVIFSATPVPGNESLVSHVINHIYRAGAEVIYNVHSKSEAMPDVPRKVHVSGHASREELRRMVELVRPQYFIPIHGEYRMLVHHARLAEASGAVRGRSIVVEDGQVLEFDGQDAKVVGTVPSGDVLVDGASVGDVSPPVLRDRAKLSQDGVCVVGVAVDAQDGAIVSGPEVATRGFLRREAECILDETRTVVRNVLEECHSESLEHVRSTLKGVLGRFFLERVGRRPLVVPIILEV